MKRHITKVLLLLSIFICTISSVNYPQNHNTDYADWEDYDSLAAVLDSADVALDSYYSNISDTYYDALPAKDHLKFMGIPLNGTLSSFQAKLLKKGLRINKSTKLLPGVRAYTGIFTGKKADFYVYYDTKSLKVFGARVFFKEEYTSYSSALSHFNYFKNELEYKYDFKITSNFIDGEGVKQSHEMSIYVPVSAYGYVAHLIQGCIFLTIRETRYYGDYYSIAIDYYDYQNYLLAQNNRNADL